MSTPIDSESTTKSMEDRISEFTKYIGSYRDWYFNHAQSRRDLDMYLLGRTVERQEQQRRHHVQRLVIPSVYRRIVSELIDVMVVVSTFIFIMTIIGDLNLENATAQLQARMIYIITAFSTPTPPPKS
ncbi:hypothetical protein ACOME3_006643 [Neoechinorhynchus agilis]